MTIVLINLDEYDAEQIIAYEGYEYRLGNGNNGPQINVKTCPNCNSDDYKVYINADSGLGNCFKCEVKFNKYKFVKLSRNLKSHNDVVRYLENMSSLVSYKPKLHIKLREPVKDWVLPQSYLIELEDHLPEYLKDRNVNAKLAKRFDLRYCEYGFYHYKDFQDKSKAVDFSRRVIIPIKDIDGNMVTFQGRDVTGTSARKYMFPNMLPGTGRYIYNADYAIKNKAKVVILNEGVFDVFATTLALESDVKYREYIACGTFGKHLSISSNNFQSEDQLSDLFKLYEQGIEEFVLLWDGEPAAISAAFESVMKLNSFGLNATVAVIGGGLDPAETDPSVLLKAIDDRRKPTTLDLIRMKLNYERA